MKNEKANRSHRRDSSLSREFEKKSQDKNHPRSSFLGIKRSESTTDLAFGAVSLMLLSFAPEENALSCRFNRSDWAESACLQMRRTRSLATTACLICHEQTARISVRIRPANVPDRRTKGNENDKNSGFQLASLSGMPFAPEDIMPIGF